MSKQHADDAKNDPADVLAGVEQRLRLHMAKQAHQLGQSTPSEQPADEQTDGVAQGFSESGEFTGPDWSAAYVNTSDETAPPMRDTLSGERIRSISMDIPLPETLGPWRIRNLLGRGGMGEVWRAQRCDGMFEMDVAVKVLRNDRADVLERFKQERRVLAQLDHPHIARLIDGGVSEQGVPYLVTEFIEGVQLDRWCAQLRPKLRPRLHLFLQICDALQYAHSELVVHRDIKPGNILVDAHEHAHLLDFGIAKLMSGPGHDESTDESPHTPEYAAPEQVQGGAITVRTDVYALGVLLYWFLTGDRPQARGGPLAEQIERILERVPPPASQSLTKSVQGQIQAHELLGDLDCIIAKAIKKNPAERYASVAEFAADVRAHLKGQPISARKTGRIQRGLAWVRRYRMLSLVTVTSVTWVMLAGGFALYQAGRARASAAAEAAQTASALQRESETLAARGFISALVKDVDLQGAAGPELARRARRYAQNSLNEFPELQAGVIWEVAGALSNFNLLDERQEMLEQQYEKLENVIPTPAEAAAACALATQRAEVGRNEDAKRLLHRAETILAHADNAQWAQLDCARIGGRALRYLGEYERAERQIANSAVQMRARYTDARGEVRHSQYIDVLNGLGIAQIQSGHFRAAEKTLFELRDLLIRSGRERSNQMANVYANLASLNRYQGRLAIAREFADKGLDLQSKRDATSFNPVTICARAQYSALLNEALGTQQKFHQLCKKEIDGDQQSPDLAKRFAWLDMAEIAVLRDNQADFERAKQELVRLSTEMDQHQKKFDLPNLNMQFLEANWAYKRGEQDNALTKLEPLLALDANLRSSLMPVKARALQLRALIAREAGQLAIFERCVADLTALTSSEYDPDHPLLSSLRQ